MQPVLIIQQTTMEKDSLSLGEKDFEFRKLHFLMLRKGSVSGSEILNRCCSKLAVKTDQSISRETEKRQPLTLPSGISALYCLHFLIRRSHQTLLYPSSSPKSQTSYIFSATQGHSRYSIKPSWLGLMAKTIYKIPLITNALPMLA